MALFEKKYCTLCNEKTDIILRQKLSDGFLCADCMHKLSSFSTGWSNRSTADVKTHIFQREANRAKYAQFESDFTAGKNSELAVDTSHRLFCFAVEKDYREGNPEVFDFSQLTDFWLEEIISNDSSETSDDITDMSNVPEDLKQYIRRDSNVFSGNCAKYIVALKAHFTVNHPFINEVTFYVDNAIARNNRSELMQAYHCGASVMLLCEQIRATV